MVARQNIITISEFLAIHDIFHNFGISYMHLSRIVCIVLKLLTSTLLLYILIHILTIRVQCNWHSV